MLSEPTESIETDLCLIRSGSVSTVFKILHDCGEFIRRSDGRKVELAALTLDPVMKAV